MKDYFPVKIRVDDRYINTYFNLYEQMKYLSQTLNMLICTFSFMEKSPSELRQHMEKKKKKRQGRETRKPT